MAKKIVVIEDNPDSAKILSDLFSRKGYNVTLVQRGDEVLEVVATVHPDLITLDMQLPGAHGYNVARWLKTDPDTKHIPIIAITAYAMSWDKEKTTRAGCEGYMSKPIDIIKLLGMVEGFIGEAE